MCLLLIHLCNVIMANTHDKCWLEDIKLLLVRNLKMYELWNNQGASNIDGQVYKLCKYMQEIFEYHWQIAVFDDVRKDKNEGNKLRCYRNFKNTFGQNIEDYLVYFKKKANKSAFSKLRCSAHKLQIERGRYTIPKTPEEKRICRHCNLNQVENEYHVVRECTLYKESRFKLDLKLYENFEMYASLNSYEKFLYIMKAEKDSCIYIEKFIEEIVKIREGL